MLFNYSLAGFVSMVFRRQAEGRRLKTGGKGENGEMLAED